MSKAPAFQFFPKDFICDINVQLMTNEALGAYAMLLCHEWINDGIPDDDKSLAILSGTRERWSEIKTDVLRCFEKKTGHENVLISQMLEKERARQEENRQLKNKSGYTLSKRQLDYRAYLRSELWNDLRNARMKLDNNKCTVCGCEAKDVHHVRYPQTWGQEGIEDLVSLCKKCHLAAHERTR